MSTNYANPASLAELSTLVERTVRIHCPFPPPSLIRAQLLDTGRLFRKSGSLPATAHLQRSIPANYESFQCALDSLSEQIVCENSPFTKSNYALAFPA